MNLWLDDRRGCRGYRLVAILRKRFAGEQDGLFGSVAGSRRSRMTRAFLALRAAIVKTALFRTPRLETAGLLAARLKSAGILRALLATLRRSVLGRRQVAASRCALRASAAVAATAASPSATAAAVSTPVPAAAAGLRAAVVAFAAIGTSIGTGRVFLRGIVLMPKILRGGGVGFRLALFGSFRMGFVMLV